MRVIPPQNAKLQQRHGFSVSVMLDSAYQYRLPAVRFAYVRTRTDGSYVTPGSVRRTYASVRTYVSAMNLITVYKLTILNTYTI